MQGVIDVAVKYAYNSVDAFSRIFKKITGCTPSKYAHGITQYRFERMNVMEKYFESSSKEMLEQYPDIKIISNLPQMQVLKNMDTRYALPFLMIWKLQMKR